VRIPGTARPRRLIVPMTLALVAVGVFSVGAAAATPTATVTLSPGSRIAGGTAQMTFTVVPDSGALSQVALTTPNAGWTVKTSAATTSNADGTTTITVNNLKVGPSSSFSLSFDATAPCTPGAYQWGLVLTKAGGTYSYDSTQLVTSVTSTGTQCTSEFSGQPADTAPGDAIFGDPFAAQFPTVFPKPARVTVTILRGDGTVDLSYNNTVTLFLVSDPTGTNPLTGDLMSKASAGVAGVEPDPFLAVIPKAFPGLFRLGATVPNVPSPAPSRGISIVAPNDKDSCSKGTTCTIDLKNDGVTTHAEATSTNSAVFVAGTTDNTSTDATFSCPGQVLITSSTVAFDYTGDGLVKVTETISKELMNAIPQNGSGLTGVCIASLTSFIQKGGTQAVFDSNLGLFVGMLRNCGPKVKSKCLMDSHKDQAGQGIVTYILASGDPPRRL
jgi:hypothetical protein